jgi:hypothetical protein
MRRKEAKELKGWNGKPSGGVPLAFGAAVVEEGFSYAGRNYRSLTAIAREITGAHWSGPRFFRLARKRGTSHA